MSDLWEINEGPNASEAVLTSFQSFIKDNYFDYEALFQSVAMPGAPYYLYFGDLQTNLYYISDNMRDDFGFPDNVVENLIEEWGKRIGDPQDKLLYHQDLQQMMEQKKDIHSLRYRITDKNGSATWVHCRGVVKWSPDKTKALFFSGCVSRLESDFSMDSVTGFLREQAVLNELSMLGAKEASALIIGFGLNHFTYINESRGRSVGDKILRSMADSLVKSLGRQYVFYRLDGIRFMAIAKAVPDGQLMYSENETVRFLRRIIEECYASEGVTVKRSASFGILHYPEDGRIPQEILENTITLINIAKTDTNVEYSVFSRNVISQQKDKSNLALSLNDSVEHGCRDFRIVVQPIVAQHSGQVIGGETLLRWTYQGKDVSPAVFIPLLEETRLILPVGKWLFEQVTEVCQKIISYQPDFLLSFNVSYLQILDNSFLPFIQETMAACGLSGRHLMLELTETHFDEMPSYLHHFVESCLALGMKFALDDFGNGFSSLQMLLKYPANVIKLDRTLMREITHSKENLDFIMSIVYACHRSGKQVCVEGVEISDELSIVRKTGCDMIQGFYFYRPMEIEDLYRMLADLLDK